MTPAEWPPILVVLIAGALPTAVWRWLGVALADHVSEDSEILVWVRCVATALVAAVIAKLIVFPDGALADVPMIVRFLAIAVGYGAFFLAKQNVLAGVLTAQGILIAGILLTPLFNGG
ncbi:MAG: AzlD domain-containing protein [Hyphomicrobiales bacterium]|nr:AzlD domain-containing protein [Hyphomicrobiales bacterium]